jgi:endonuclease/exonuclease/phosphatase family metal-dependent hydrolase
VIGGDFNILRFSSEKNKAFVPNRFSDMFNSVINAYDLRELYMSGGIFTWPNNQANPTLERLDRILVSKEWEGMFPTVLVFKKPREFSDHNPLILDSRSPPACRSREF